MKLKWTRGSVLTLVLFGIGLALTMATGWRVTAHTSAANATPGAVAAQVDGPPTKTMVHLYFGDSQGRYLVAEQRIVEKPADRASLGRLLIEALIEGPSQGAVRTLPGDARLDAVYITRAGVACVDFAADSFTAHPGGIGAELLSIYSIVNTLVLNVDGIRSVKFLIDGREASTLAGHADLQAPFEVDMLWVR